ncbi:Spc7 kinetochore protein-domain-containing protein [Aspergillus oleicola]
MSAACDIRLLIENQFRNVNTHTRLLSKATWYEWRMKLLEGLKEGLGRHMEEMKGDDDVLSKHEKLLNDAVPALATKHSSLEQEATNLQQLADELENCDQDKLWNARGKLSDIEEEISPRRRLELKAEFTAQIQEAERVKEECRGWSAKEIRELKDSVHRIKHQTGWSISSASSSESEAGPVLTTSYRRQLQLKFYPQSFRIGSNKDSMPTSKADTSIEVSYIPESETRSTQHARPLSSIALLILKSLQACVIAINQSSVSPKQLLQFVSEAWDLALKVEEEARMLGFNGVTNTRLSEVEGKPSLRAGCTLLGTLHSAVFASPSKSRVDIDFAVTIRILGKDEPELGTLDIQTEVLASKVYGFGTDNESGLSEKEMRSILNKELKGHNKTGVKLGSGVWSKVVQMLSGRVF